VKQGEHDQSQLPELKRDQRPAWIPPGAMPIDHHAALRGYYSYLALFCLVIGFLFTRSAPSEETSSRLVAESNRVKFKRNGEELRTLALFLKMR
jgi:hypothetical protein